MGNNLFGADIAGQLARALGAGLLAGTLTKVTEGARSGNSTTAPAKTETGYSFKGYPESLDQLRDGSVLQDAQGAVFLLGDTLPSGIVPEPGDFIAVANTAKSRIIKVTADPELAGYLCQHA